MPESTNPHPEEWRAVTAYEGVYEISDHGRVRRIAPGKGVGNMHEPRSPERRPRGYQRIRLYRDGAPSTNEYVHRMVAAAFLGPCPAGLEVHHRDSDPSNNHVGNLSYVTHHENMLECLRAGRRNSPRGEAHRSAKLTERDVRTIRQLHPALTGTALAERYGVGSSTIYAILNRRHWKHVE